VLPDFVDALGDGLYTIDTDFGRPRFDAAYLIVDDGHAAFVDTGTNHAVPRLLQTLAALAIPVHAVDWVIPTHVHLDHAGHRRTRGHQLAALRRRDLHERAAGHLLRNGAAHPGVLHGGLTPGRGARDQRSEDEKGSVDLIHGRSV